MALREFDDTSTLDTEALRALLQTGTAVERLWAVWALGLRVEGVRGVVGHVGREPSPGVRRAMGVVLAGAGEVELLVALSRDDPSEHVRANATQLLVRFARAGRVAWSHVLDRFADTADVRAAVVGQIGIDAPSELRDRVLACLADDDPGVRREAFEAAVRFRVAGLVPAEPLRAWLEQWRDDARTCVARWFELDDAAAIADALTGSSRAVRGEAIRARRDLVPTILAPLVTEDLYDDLEREIGLAAEELPTDLLLRRFVERPHEDRYVVALTPRVASARDGAALRAVRKQLDHQLRTLKRREAKLQALAEDRENEQASIDLAELEATLQTREALRAALQASGA